MSDVEWRPVLGHDQYEVSNTGLVRSNKYGKTRIIAQFKRADGYRVIVIYKNGKAYQKRVSRLILESFVEACPPGMECSHLDGNRANNNLENLKWESHYHNITRRKGLKLSRTDVSLIRYLLTIGRLVSEISRDFEISKQQVYKIKNRKQWRL